MIFSLIILLFVLAILVITELARRFLWMIVFGRLGEKRWKAWVPVVDLWTVFKLGRFPGFLSLPIWGILGAYVYFSFTQADRGSVLALILLIILIPAIVVSLMACFRITKRLGLHGAYFLLYLAGEIAWLAVLVIATTKPGAKLTR